MSPRVPGGGFNKEKRESAHLRQGKLGPGPAEAPLMDVY